MEFKIEIDVVSCSHDGTWSAKIHEQTFSLDALSLSDDSISELAQAWVDENLFTDSLAYCLVAYAEIVEA